MSIYTNLTHPMFSVPGSAQNQRLLPALDPKLLSLDGREMADWLDVIYQFSRQVNHYDETMRLGDWRPFFEDSLPFTLARIYKLDITTLEANLRALLDLLAQQPEPTNLQTIFDFVYDEMLSPLRQWARQFADSNNTFGTFINGLVSADLSDVMREYIALANGVGKVYCVRRRNFNPWVRETAWGLQLTDLYCVDLNFQQITGGAGARILHIGEQLREMAEVMFGVLRQLSVQAPNFLTEAIRPEQDEHQQLHAPHLGLLFTFFELMKPFRQNFNQLSVRHLEHYYQKVLGLAPRPLQPDQAFLTIELQKHEKVKLLPAGLTFVGGKDDNGQDVLYRLEEDVVIDEAQVAEVRTLFVDYDNTYNCEEGEEVDVKSYVVGLYAAPIANSADGKGEDFLTDSKSWATLGARHSKYFAETTTENVVLQDQPFAKAGLVLASPVLYLQEGQRKIIITLCLKAEELECFPAEDAFLSILESGGSFDFNEDFNFFLSNKGGWKIVTPESVVFDGLSENDESSICAEGVRISLTIEINLDSSFPSVDFMDAELAGTGEGLIAPAIKMVLNDDVSRSIISRECRPVCDLERCHEADEEFIVSVYSFLRFLEVCEACIEVEVCGVRNLVVQSDENLQNVDDLIYPFGTRPSIAHDMSTGDPELKGSSFYIGNKEIFCKNWGTVHVNFNWFKKPNSLTQHYIGYENDAASSDTEASFVQEKDFAFRVSVLDEGSWKKEYSEINLEDGELVNSNPYLQPCDLSPANNLDWIRPMFIPDIDEGYTPICSDEISGQFYDRQIQIERSYFTLEKELNKFDNASLLPINTSSRDSFLRLTMRCQDFQHDKYSFILARQMMAFGKYPDDFVFGASYMYRDGNDIIMQPVTDEQVFLDHIQRNKLDVEVLASLQTTVCQFLNVINDRVINLQAYFNQELGDDGVVDDIKEALVVSLSNLIGGITEAQIEENADEFAEEIRDRFVNDIIEPIATEIRTCLLDYFIENPTSAQHTTAINDLIIVIQSRINDTGFAGLIRSYFLAAANDIYNVNLRTAIASDLGAPTAAGDITQGIAAYIATITPGGDSFFNSAITAILDGVATDISDPALRIAIDGVLDSFINHLGTGSSFEDLTRVTSTGEIRQKIEDPIVNWLLVQVRGIYITFVNELLSSSPADAVESAVEAAFGNDSLVRITEEKRKELLGKVVDSQPVAGDTDFTLNTLIWDYRQNLGNSTLLRNFIGGLSSNEFDDLFECLGIFEIMRGLSRVVDCGENGATDSTVIIPNEPYTPTIKDLSLDYTASAKSEDIELIHLYPYENTYKSEDLAANPRLLPTIVDEGTLFLGIDKLVPGNNLNLLFQLAEATADSESLAADIKWHYLSNNQWVDLQDGFHVLRDGTQGLTRSGIIKIATPRDLTKGPENTIMPPGLHWFKASARRNVQAVAETIGIHTQAIEVTYWHQPQNQRSNLQLPAGIMKKLLAADSSIKKINQPYASFGGVLAELENRLYLRISEQLRHKGRGIAKYDYERILLDRFTEIYRVRCLNHSFSLNAVQYRRDLEIAPGFVSLAVIPDLRKLDSGNAVAPKAPVSLLTTMRQYLKQRTSPFVRLKIVNPRYEQVNILGTVILKPGKSSTFYTSELREALRLYLSPWLEGKQEALSFGRIIAVANVISFIECLDYVDYICDLTIQHEEEEVLCYQTDNATNDGVTIPVEEIQPLTARSILTAGKMLIAAENWKCPENSRPEDDCDPLEAYPLNCRSEPIPAQGKTINLNPEPGTLS